MSEPPDAIIRYIREALRWSEHHGEPVPLLAIGRILFGDHQAGVKRTQRIVEHCVALGVVSRTEDWQELRFTDEGRSLLRRR
jgi:hypothetical protein